MHPCRRSGRDVFHASRHLETKLPDPKTFGEEANGFRSGGHRYAVTWFNASMAFGCSREPRVRSVSVHGSECKYTEKRCAKQSSLSIDCEENYYYHPIKELEMLQRVEEGVGAPRGGY